MTEFSVPSLITTNMAILDGFRLHYRRAEAVESLILLHGLAERPVAWRKVMPALAAEHFLVDQVMESLIKDRADLLRTFAPMFTATGGFTIVPAAQIDSVHTIMMTGLAPRANQLTHAWAETDFHGDLA